MTITEIRDLFGLDTAGDAWEMVLENDWEHVRDESGKWQVTVPTEALP